MPDHLVNSGNHQVIWLINKFYVALAVAGSVHNGDDLRLILSAHDIIKYLSNPFMVVFGRMPSA